MESYVLITKGHAGIIKAMKDSLPRFEKNHKEYLESLKAWHDNGIPAFPSPDRDSEKAREIAAMMMFKEVVKLSPSDAEFITDQIKLNKHAAKGIK